MVIVEWAGFIHVVDEFFYNGHDVDLSKTITLSETTDNLFVYCV